MQLSSLNSDVEIWLNTKLEGSWSSEKISSLLTPSILDAAKTRFSFLDTSIKLKMLFSFVTLSKKVREDLDSHVQGILGLASEDDDEWVKVISKLFASLAEEDGTATGEEGQQVTHSNTIENEHFIGLQNQLRENLQETGPPRFWPLEYPYVNTNVADIQGLESNFTNPHFKLKHKLEEPSLSSSRRNIPTMPRSITTPDKKKLSDSLGATSLGAIGASRKRPSMGSQLSRSVDSGLEKKEAAKKKLRVLDIEEVKVIQQQQHRLLAEEEEEEKLRKKKERTEAAEAKRQEREERKLKRKEERDAKKKLKEEMKLEKEAKRRDKQRQQQIAKANKKISFPSRPSLGPLGDESPASLLGRTMPIADSSKPMPMGLPQGLYQTIQPRGNTPQQPQGVGMMPFKYNTTPSPMMSTTGRPGGLRPDAVPGSLQASSLLSQALLPQSSFSAQNFSLSSQPTMSPMSLQPSQTQQPTQQQHTWSSYGVPPAAPAPAPQASTLPNNLFDQANCLSEANKVILLNFLSGQAMQNPNPASGPIKQILLNEEEKMNPDNNGKYLEQIIFEINYNTGSWRKLRRKKMIPPASAPPSLDPQQQQLQQLQQLQQQQLQQLQQQAKPQPQQQQQQQMPSQPSSMFTYQPTSQQFVSADAQMPDADPVQQQTN